MSCLIRKIEKSDHCWINDLLKKEWGSNRVVSRGKIHHADLLPGFIAESNGMSQGLLTYYINKDNCEIVSLNSIIEKQGIGSALISALKDEAAKCGCKRVWLITTNDNTDAVRFYRNRGFKIIAVHSNTIEESRKLKPEIPLLGIGGVPILDEIEMEINICKNK